MNGINNIVQGETRYPDTRQVAGAANKPEKGGPQRNAADGSYVNPNSTDTELKKEGYSQADIKGLKRTGKVRCETCSSRKYADESGDSGVSFKTPTKLSPSQAAAAVSSHENEHVARNAAKASQDNREVVQSSVRIFSSVCPECGISYISGGETRTTTKKKAQTQEFAAKENEKDAGVGRQIDQRIG